MRERRNWGNDGERFKKWRPITWLSSGMKPTASDLIIEIEEKDVCLATAFLFMRERKDIKKGTCKEEAAYLRCTISNPLCKHWVIPDSWGDVKAWHLLGRLCCRVVCNFPSHLFFFIPQQAGYWFTNLRGTEDWLSLEPATREPDFHWARTQIMWRAVMETHGVVSRMDHHTKLLVMFFAIVKILLYNTNTQKVFDAQLCMYFPNFLAVGTTFLNDQSQYIKNRNKSYFYIFIYLQIIFGRILALEEKRVW